MGLLDNIKDAVGMGDGEKKAEDAAQAERDQAVADAQRRSEEAQAAQAEEAARNEAEAKAREEGRQAAEAEAAAKAAADAAAAQAAQEAAAAQAAAEAAAAAAAAAQPETYTVVSGDTLSGIGERFGVSWEEIARVNNVENPDLIIPGQVFTIPR